MLREAKEELKRSLIFLGGVAVGARCMYMLDPDRGYRRRALARDKVIGAMHHAERILDKSVRDLGNRLVGVIATATSLCMSERVPDEILVERVRARLGRVVSHPAAIEVEVSQGCVVLRGPVLDQDLHKLLRSVRSIPGVTAVDDQLMLHRSPDGVPGLQGPGRGHADREFELLRQEWAPATRLVLGTAGGLLLAAGARKRGLGGAALGLLGAGLVTRTLTNRTPQRFLGVDGQAAIEVQKTLHIRGSLEQVFDLLADPEKLPRVMTHVQNVEKVGENRYRWTVVGPLNTRLSWEADITQFHPHRLLAWRSVPGAVLENAGTMQFSPGPGGTTRVHIRWRYSPPAGELGHIVARFLHADLKRMLDEDLVRLKSLLEHGKTTAHHQPVTLSEVAG